MSIRFQAIDSLLNPPKVGPRGPRGPKGDKGDKGDPGADGKPGKAGLAGRPGRDGSDGKDGAPGPAGRPGRDGQDGARGERGQRGPKGEDGEDGASVEQVQVDTLDPEKKATADWNRESGLLKLGIPRGQRGERGPGGGGSVYPVGAQTAGGEHPDLDAHNTLGLATQAELDAHAAGPHGGGGGDHPDLAAHNTLGLATQDELDTALVDHEAEADPHPIYETSAEAQAKVDAHVAAGDPHPTYLTAAEGNAAYDATGAAAAAVTTHEGAADPHTGYLLESGHTEAVHTAMAGLATQAELDTHAAGPHGGSHPDLATHDALGLATQSELDAHGHSHVSLSGVSSDQHHAKVHTHADAGEGGTVAYSAITGTPTVPVFVGCRVKRTSNQALTNGGITYLSWQAEDYDSDNMAEQVTNPTRITIPTGKGGKYHFDGFSFGTSSGGTGLYSVLRKNGTTIVAAGVAATDASASRWSISTDLELAAGDYIEWGLNVTGSSKNALDAGVIFPYLSCHKIS